MNVRGRKVYVGLSGGVDSAVSAALLHKGGAEVTGVFIKGWYPPGMPCTWAADRRDALRVAARLRIPFITLDAAEVYKKAVIDYLLSEYKAGRTPNPDVMCNKEVKFGVFYHFAIASGVDYIATGHYRSGKKDQTYFLWAVPREVLERTLFPVGALEKGEVRRLAKKFNLPVAEKKDSQGVCFLGSVSVKDFLRKELGDNPAILHTLGERVPGGYVTSKDVAHGTIEIGAHPIAPSEVRPIAFAEANWVADAERVTGAQYRYRGPMVPGKIIGDMFLPYAALPEPASPGQSIVFYDGTTYLGGGIIRA